MIEFRARQLINLLQTTDLIDFGLDHVQLLPAALSVPVDLLGAQSARPGYFSTKLELLREKPYSYKNLLI